MPAGLSVSDDPHLRVVFCANLSSARADDSIGFVCASEGGGLFVLRLVFLPNASKSPEHWIATTNDNNNHQKMWPQPLCLPVTESGAKVIGVTVEPCAGIGDRTRFLLSQVQDILEATRPTARVQIDAPTTGLAILEPAVYLDPAGWWGELLRYRSYDVRERKALPYSQLLSKKENVDAGSGAAPDSAPETFYYSHFLPNNFAIHEYNACYFHALFQPTPALRADLDRHNAAIDGNNKTTTNLRLASTTARAISRPLV